MKQKRLWVMAATLTCGAMMLTSCSSSDNPVDAETGASTIARHIHLGG